MFDAFILRLLAFVVTIAILVVVHELGHYWVARWCGVKVLRFSFGFGRVLWSKKRGPDQTEWAISAIPLGGYVKMLGEGDDGDKVDPADLPRAFNRQSVGKRFAIVAAGPLTNLLLAILLFAFLGVIGTQELQPVLAAPKDGTPVAAAGFQKMDRVTEVAGVNVNSLMDLHWELLKHAREDVPVTVMRNNAAVNLHLSTQSVTMKDEEEGNVMPRLGFRFFSGPPLVAQVMPDSPAAAAGLKAGDKVVAVNGVALDTRTGLIEAIEAEEGRALTVTVNREGNRFDVTLTPHFMRDETTGKDVPRIGVMLTQDTELLKSFLTTVRYDPLTATWRGITQTWDLTWLSLKMMGRMVIGDASLKNISGPITIADFAGQSAQQGWDRFVAFLALISVALGVINLLPVPLLDGGHLLYYSVELIRGRPLSEQAMAIGQRIGMAFIFFLIALALLNDFTRLLQ
jgi:regulator of sigma E protease